MSRPTPVPDVLTEPYWTAIGQGRLLLPRCTGCGRFHFYPKPACPWCRDTSIEWAPASGKGRVHSFSVVYRAPSVAFSQDVPYVIAIVQTDEGPHMMTRVVGLDGAAVHVGLRVRVRIEPVGDGIALPVFETDPVETGDADDE